MNIIIKQARFTDIESIHAIEQQSISSWSYDQFVEEISREFSVLLAAFLDDMVSGYISAWIIGDQAEIHSLAVSSRFSRIGIGGKLLNSLSVEAAGRGCSSILLEVKSRNVPAVNFYKKNGFTETGRRKNYYHDDDALLMEKKI
ncbi:MAG TPA: ribosomal protein S18-alanine N-acetyltransferase [Spirochaetota bacterium]|nr:ribosomal protein S18-alanine N-acetyltransferase [Spirochaetota bacterium]